LEGLHSPRRRQDAKETPRVDLRNLRARTARLRDLRLVLETRTIQNLDRLGHRRGVQRPTQTSLIARISLIDWVIIPPFRNEPS
jgi:hypothetical protein